MRPPIRGGRIAVDPNLAWSREKQLALMVGVAVGVLLVAAGLVLAVLQALRPHDPSPARPAAAASPAAPHPEDATAVGVSPSRPGGPQPLLLPRPTRLGGAGGVNTGFPRTPEGAVAQLADLDLTVLTAMRPELARTAYQAWALPGGVGPEEWIITRNVDSFHRSFATTGAGNVTITVTPVAAQVAAIDGPDAVTGCVLLEIHARARGEGRLTYGHCEHLQWADARWQIAPGDPPTQPAAVIPGSAEAAAAGWRPWTTA